MQTLSTNNITKDNSDEILLIIDVLARHVHEEWVRGRLEDGWTWGPVRNDQLHQHPNLVPYDELAESDKEYDRNTAMATIRALQTLGFHIEKNVNSEK